MSAKSHLKDTFQCLFENSMDAVLLTVPIGRIVAANRAACAMFKMTEVEICEAGRDGLTVATDPRLSTYLRERSRAGSFRGELTHRRKDGSTFQAETSSVILDDGQRAFVILRDITRQKQADEALRRTLSLLEGIATGTEEMIAALDHDFRFLFFNDAYRRETGALWGRDPEIGMSMVDVLAPWPEEQRKAKDLWGRALKGESFSTTMEFGQSEQERQIYEFVFNPLHGSQGQQIGAAHVIRNVTERKRAEERLRESEVKFRTVFEQAAIGIGRVNFADARWIDINDAFCRMLGYSPEEMLDTAWPQITHPDDLDLDLIPFRRMAAGELDGYELEKRFIHKCGHHFWAHLTLSLVRDAQGRPDYEIAIIQNIDERKRVEEELRKAKAAAEEASRAKSEFLANMSHEIRTPMTVFMAAVEHLLQTEIVPERRHLLGMANQSAERLRGLIDDILDFSRIEARKVVLEEELFDIRSCVREVVDMFTLPAGGKNLHLQMEVAPDMPDWMIGDPDRLGQVLINLIGNAVKFTQEGEIRVCVQPRGNCVECTVADTGIGIPEKKRDLLFQSFSQVDSSFTRKFGGTGLGLAISKGLVELMGGEIGVRSQEGKGSVFTFTLPLKAAQGYRSAPVETLQKESGNDRLTVRILLAEDDPMIRDLITITLAQRGWQAETAGTGLEAVEKWERDGFDLILMDLQMPVMDGIEATKAIRDREAGGKKHTCVVGLTAHASRKTQEDCLQAGMDKVLAKPARVADLYAAIEDFLNRRTA